MVWRVRLFVLELNVCLRCVCEPVCLCVRAFVCFFVFFVLSVVMYVCLFDVSFLFLICKCVCLFVWMLECLV